MATPFTTYDGTGKIISSGSCDESNYEYQYNHETEFIIPVEANIWTQYVDNGVLVDIAAKPSELHTFDYTTKTWIAPTLDYVKELRKNYITLSRAKANQTSFTFNGKEIAADQLSRSDIDGTQGYVLINNTFPADWPGGWKCMDNTYVAITNTQTWFNFYTAMVNQGTTNFAHSQTLKAQIDACTTIEEVEAINW